MIPVEPTILNTLSDARIAELQAKYRGNEEVTAIIEALILEREEVYSLMDELEDDEDEDDEDSCQFCDDPDCPGDCEDDDEDFDDDEDEEPEDEK